MTSSKWAIKTTAKRPEMKKNEENIWLPKRYLKMAIAWNGDKVSQFNVFALLSLSHTWHISKTSKRPLCLRFVHVENSSHHHQHLLLSCAISFVRSGTKAHSLTSAQCSCHFNIPDRCLNGNVTRNNNNEKKTASKNVCGQIKTYQMRWTLEEWEWTFNVGFVHFYATSFYSIHY